MTLSIIPHRIFAPFCIFKGLGWVCRESTDRCVCAGVCARLGGGDCCSWLGWWRFKEHVSGLVLNVSGSHSSLLRRRLFSTVTMQTRAARSTFFCACVCTFAAPEFCLCSSKHNFLLSHWDIIVGDKTSWNIYQIHVQRSWHVYASSPASFCCLKAELCFVPFFRGPYQQQGRVDVQLPAQFVGQSCFFEQRPLETQDVCLAGKGEEEDDWLDVLIIKS